MTDLHKAMEQFLAAFAREVAIQVVNELDARTLRHNREREEFFAQAAPPRTEFFDASALKLDKVAGPCPKTDQHPRHTWRFPDSGWTRECPGVKFPEELCLIDVPHDAHDWEHDPNNWGPAAGALGRHCPGIPVARPRKYPDRQCPDNLAHHEHTWHRGPDSSQRVTAGTPRASRHTCPGLEADREVQWCGVSEDHQPHEGPHPVGTGDLKFCRGRREVPVSRCLEDRTHLPHNWQDEQDKTAACPGKSRPWDTNVVPAGPDRHA